MSKQNGHSTPTSGSLTAGAEVSIEVTSPGSANSYLRHTGVKRDAGEAKADAAAWLKADRRREPINKTATPKGGRFAVSVKDEWSGYRSFLRQLIRSPRVVVELETGALWVLSL
ncbi:MAG TPA: hypothetical protein VGL22_09670 [Terracidiphilus sp.]|jgi:hypothetical protein